MIKNSLIDVFMRKINLIMTYWSLAPKRFNPLAAELFVLFLFNIYMKMELLTPFAASNDVNMCLSMKNNNYLMNLEFITNSFMTSRGILIGL